MAYRNCFKKPNDNLNSGQYISRKKSRTIFKASVDLANNGGVYHKKTESGQDMGTYVGDVNISRDGKKCCVNHIVSRWKREYIFLSSIYSCESALSKIESPV